MNIVIVEDEMLTALFLKEEIEDYGHDVLGIFDNGTELLHFLEYNEIDVIFMDIQINGALDGIQLAHIVYKRYAHVSLVFVTSYKDSDTIQSTQSLKPIGFLVKPIIEVDIEIILMILQNKYQKTTTKIKEEIHISLYTYTIESKMLYYKQELITLTYKEQLFFHELIVHKGTYMSAEQLIYTLWNDVPKNTSSLRELAYRLRKKLTGITIENSPNLGYMLV